MKGEQSLAARCAALGVSRPGYYRWKDAEPGVRARAAAQPKPTAPNQVWVSDITYVRTAEGWLYVAAILDLYSRRIVGWATGASLAAELVLRALTMALRHRRPPAGLLYHSDRGVQYACGDFRAALAEARLKIGRAHV